MLTDEKVGEGHICLWCNERSKAFLSVQAVQRHMVDKGHCKVLFEGDSVFEYSDYYDYRCHLLVANIVTESKEYHVSVFPFRSSYPDYNPDAQNDDNDEEEESGSDALEDSGYELVLPSGSHCAKYHNRMFLECDVSCQGVPSFTQVPLLVTARCTDTTART